MSGYTRVPDYPVKTDWNDNLTALELNSAYSFGRGVLNGLVISAGSGRTLNMTSGVLMGLKAVSLSSASHTVTDNSTVYIWINESGTFTETATTADPGGTFVCLGRVVTSGGSITSVDQTSSTGGRMSTWRWTALRTCQIGESLIYADLTNGRVGIGKTPSALLDVNGAIAASGAFSGVTATLAQGTITSVAPVLDISSTWNSGGTTFTAIKSNITDSASAAASLLIDLQVGGTSKFSVKKDGTVTSGIWGGTAIGVTAGGTGLTSLTQGDLIYGSAANTFSALAKDANATRYLSNQGASNSPSWNQVNLANGVTGTLPVTSGGIGIATVAQGDLLYGSASNVISALAKNTSATRYLSNTGSSNSPAWAQIDLTNGVTGTLPIGNGGVGFTTIATGDIVYGSASNTIGKLTVGSTSDILTVVGGKPAWTSSPTLTGVTLSSTGTGTMASLTVATAGGTSTTYALSSVLDSGNGAAIYASNYNNYAFSGHLVSLKIYNGSDTGDMVYMTNAGTGNYITCDSAFIVYKTGGMKVGASTTAKASINIPSGTAPTSPVSGDFWYDGTNLKFRDGLTTRTLTWT